MSSHLYLRVQVILSFKPHQLIYIKPRLPPTYPAPPAPTAPAAPAATDRSRAGADGGRRTAIAHTISHCLLLASIPSFFALFLGLAPPCVPVTILTVYASISLAETILASNYEGDGGGWASAFDAGMLVVCQLVLIYCFPFPYHAAQCPAS